MGKGNHLFMCVSPSPLNSNPWHVCLFSLIKKKEFFLWRGVWVVPSQHSKTENNGCGSLLHGLQAHQPVSPRSFFFLNFPLFFSITLSIIFISISAYWFPLKQIFEGTSSWVGILGGALLQSPPDNYVCTEASIGYEQIVNTGLYSTVSFILTIIPQSVLTVLLKKVSSFLTFCNTSKDERVWAFPPFSHSPHLRRRRISCACAQIKDDIKQMKTTWLKQYSGV